jgi:hypothetical protein
MNDYQFVQRQHAKKLHSTGSKSKSTSTKPTFQLSSASCTALCSDFTVTHVLNQRWPFVIQLCAYIRACLAYSTIVTDIVKRTKLRRQICVCPNELAQVGLHASISHHLYWSWRIATRRSPSQLSNRQIREPAAWDYIHVCTQKSEIWDWTTNAANNMSTIPRAKNAYMLFADDKRGEVMKENAGEKSIWLALTSTHYC